MLSNDIIQRAPDARHAIARRRVIDTMRRRPKVEVEVMRDLMGEDGNELADRMAWAAEIRWALTGLPDKQRQAIELAYFAELTQSQIAQLRGPPRHNQSPGLAGLGPSGRRARTKEGPMSDPHAPDHVSEELATLLAGECDRTTTLRVVAHLRTCPHCSDELISIAAVTGALRFSNRAERSLNPPTTGGPSAVLPPPLDRDNLEPDPNTISEQVATIVRTDHARRRRRRISVAAAAVILLAPSLIGRQPNHTNTSHTPAAVQAPLRPIQAPPGAGGRIQVTASSQARQLDVHTIGLPGTPTPSPTLSPESTGGGCDRRPGDLRQDGKLPKSGPPMRSLHRHETIGERTGHNTVVGRPSVAAFGILT
jgi:hypothetical protein